MVLFVLANTDILNTPRQVAGAQIKEVARFVCIAEAARILVIALAVGSQGIEEDAGSRASVAIVASRVTRGNWHIAPDDVHTAE